LREWPAGFRVLRAGWAEHDSKLVATIKRLDDAELCLAAGPGQWAIWQIGSHIAGVRAHWICDILEEGDPEVRAAFAVDARVLSAHGPDASWEHDEEHPRSREEIVAALERTWGMLDSCIASWSAAEAGGAPPRLKYGRTRGWVAWHLAEHDIHHAAAISLTLGIHGKDGLGR
jgi:uncharacterized damage-inducible protein DinB